MRVKLWKSQSIRSSVCKTLRPAAHLPFPFLPRSDTRLETSATRLHRLSVPKSSKLLQCERKMSCLSRPTPSYHLLTSLALLFKKPVLETHFRKLALCYITKGDFLPSPRLKERNISFSGPSKLLQAALNINIAFFFLSSSTHVGSFWQ